MINNKTSDFLCENLCIIIPTKNEEYTIGKVLEKLKKITNSKNILVVDGYSSDRTIEIIKSMDIKYISDNKKGKGDALKLGVQSVSKDIIVFMDGDESHDPSDICRLIEPLQNNTADMVIGSRMLGGSDELHGTFNKFIRVTGNNLLAVLINKKFGTSLTDIENGFRAINREVFNKINLKSDGFTIEQEMVLKCLKKGFRIAEIPSHEYARKFGYSKLKTSQGFGFLLNFFKEYLFH